MERGQGKYQFGGVSYIGAEAIGEPGHRSFRLVVKAGMASASLWLEKEQLSQLAVYIQEIIASVSEKTRAREGQPPEPEWSGAAEEVEFKVGKLAIGHDASSTSFLFMAHDNEEDDEEEEPAATLTFWVTLEQAREMAEEALKVCAAGRPVCPLCGESINPEGHVCPRSNGHLRLNA